MHGTKHVDISTIFMINIMAQLHHEYYTDAYVDDTSKPNYAILMTL